MSLIELKIPNMGGSTSVTVAEVYIKPGDQINIDDNLLMLETDKATMEVPATSKGVVKEVKVKVGDKVSEGSIIMTLEAAVDDQPSNSKLNQKDTLKESSALNAIKEPATEVKDSTKASEENKKTLEKSSQLKKDSATTRAEGEVNPVIAKANTNEPTLTINEEGFAKAFASPSIRKLARELGVDLSNIKGSGNKNRIIEDDVKSTVKRVMNSQVSSSTSNLTGLESSLELLPWPNVDYAKYGEIETISLSRIKGLTAANMARNWIVIPHVTIFENADIYDLEEFRKQLNEEYKKAEIKISFLTLLIKAVSQALKTFPGLNASLDGKSIIIKKYYNVGFAVDTKQGLLVPVIKNADQKGLLDITQEMTVLINAARDGKLKPADMQGGTFTISSLGGIGSTAFTPIINAPEVAILGISNSETKPIWNGKEFIPRLILPLSLSFDHRVIDGALAARFTTYLAGILRDFRRLSL